MEIEIEIHKIIKQYYSLKKKKQEILFLLKEFYFIFVLLNPRWDFNISICFIKPSGLDLLYVVEAVAFAARHRPSRLLVVLVLFSVSTSVDVLIIISRRLEDNRRRCSLLILP